jgi:hypothetical protein
MKLDRGVVFIICIAVLIAIYYLFPPWTIVGGGAGQAYKMNRLTGQVWLVAGAWERKCIAAPPLNPDELEPRPITALPIVGVSSRPTRIHCDSGLPFPANNVSERDLTDAELKEAISVGIQRFNLLSRAESPSYGE